MPGSGADALTRFPATTVLIAINVVVFLFEIAGGSGGLSPEMIPLVNEFGLRGFSVAHGGEWYRLITGGFLHANLVHIGFNMFFLFILGRLLEPAIGTPRFLALYFASLLAGSFGALALTNQFEVTVGASGAIFGVLVTTVLVARQRGSSQIATELALLLIINLVLSFSVSHISVGGHIGGMIGGAVCALAILAGERGMLGRNRLALELVAMGAVAAISVLGALAVA